MKELIINVLIVDDHQMVRKGLAAFFEMIDDINVVGVAKGGSDAITRFVETQPDVVLMDLIMPETGGIEAIKRIISLDQNAKIIALTSFAEDQLVHDALGAGAIGFILKDISPEDLSKAIHKAHEGIPVLSPEATRTLMLRTQHGNPKAEVRLSSREMEVLHLLVSGLSNRQIAEQLMVGQATVKTHVSTILSKLQVTNRTEAVAVAIRDNLLD